MLPLTQEVSTIAHVIELAIAPVFLITGIGALLVVMSNRLARIIGTNNELPWPSWQSFGKSIVCFAA